MQSCCGGARGVTVERCGLGWWPREVAQVISASTCVVWVGVLWKAERTLVVEGPIRLSGHRMMGWHVPRSHPLSPPWAPSTSFVLWARPLLPPGRSWSARRASHELEGGPGPRNDRVHRSKSRQRITANRQRDRSEPLNCSYSESSAERVKQGPVLSHGFCARPAGWTGKAAQPTGPFWDSLTTQVGLTNAGMWLDVFFLWDIVHSILWLVTFKTIKNKMRLLL